MLGYNFHMKVLGKELFQIFKSNKNHEGCLEIIFKKEKIILQAFGVKLKISTI